MRSRPKGYFLTILQEKDRYLVGEEKGLPISSRRYLNFGVTLKEARKEAEDVKLLEGEHLWLGYQPEDTMPYVTEAWVQVYGKRIQYRSRRKGFYGRKGDIVIDTWHGIHYGSLFPFLYNGAENNLKTDRLGYNFTRDVIARKNLTVRQKKHLCSLCKCSGDGGHGGHTDCRDIIKNGRIEPDIMMGRCKFSKEWEERVKRSFPFGVICWKWGIYDSVIDYAKKNLW